MTRTVLRLGLPLLVAGSLIAAAPAAAQTGGTGTPGGTPAPTPTPPVPSGPAGKAKLTKGGLARPPANAPANVVNAIAAANQIVTFPYVWGGGHRDFYNQSGYDCSGAVSYVLHGAGLLTSPLTSGSLASSWGSPGKGQWITVYANASHTYMVVAGLRFDTSAVGEKLNNGSGPRWRHSKRKPSGYASKYYPSL